MGDNIGKGTVVVYIEQGIFAVSGLVISALLARSLTTDGYGIYKLVSSLSLFAAYATSFGIETTVSRYIPGFIAKDKRKLVNQLLGLALGIRILAVLILFLVVIGLQDQLGALLNAQPIFDSLLALVLPYIGLSLVNNVIGKSLLIAYSQRHILGYVRIVSKLLVVLLVGYLALRGEDIAFAITILLIAALFEFLVYGVIAIRKVWNNVRQDTHEIGGHLPYRRLRSFSLYHWLFKGGHVFREYSVDHLVITYFLSPSQVAFYGVAVAIPSMLRSFAPGRMLHGVLLPVFVERYETEKSHGSIVDGYTLLQKINIALLAPLVVFFLLFTPELIGLVYSETYVPATQAARILIGFSLFQSMADPFYVVSQAAERANLVFYSSLWGLCNLAANILLIPLFGIEGAALATGLTGVLVFLYFIGVYRYGIGVRFPFLLSTCGTTAVNLFPALVLFGIAKVMGLFTPWGVGLALLGGGSYAFAAYINRVFSPTEWEFIQRRLNGVPVVGTLGSV